MVAELRELIERLTRDRKETARRAATEFKTLAMETRQHQEEAGELDENGKIMGTKTISKLDDLMAFVDQPAD